MRIQLEDGSGYIETRDNCKQCFGRGAFVVSRTEKQGFEIKEETLLQPCSCIKHFDEAGQPVTRFYQKL